MQHAVNMPLPVTNKDGYLMAFRPLLGCSIALVMTPAQSAVKKIDCKMTPIFFKLFLTNHLDLLGRSWCNEKLVL